MRIRGFILASPLLLTMGSCGSGGIGDPCTPEDEFRSSFSGFSFEEVNIESRSFQCQTRVCIIENFQGRVSCPYGQGETELGLPASDPARCRIPGTDGSDPRDGVSVAVQPQFVDRNPADAVYCSCRCAGPDPNAKYCKCPGGFECVDLVDDLGLGKAQLAGSYCVKEGERFKGRAPLCQKFAPPGEIEDDPSCTQGQYYSVLSTAGQCAGTECTVNP